MRDVKLYEVSCSVNFYIEVEASNEGDAEALAIEHLESRGLYDLTVCSSPITIDNVKEVN